MVIGSHNSWSYLPCKKWWMKLMAFTARCQECTIFEQYKKYNVGCFDLRVRFNNNDVVIAHGIIEYDITKTELLNQLKFFNSSNKSISLRILHEVRNKKQYTDESINKFRKFCRYIEETYTNINCWGGRNLYNWEKDYEFAYEPSCEEKYSSVCKPKLIDDWYPKWFAKKNNTKIKKEGSDKKILLIDFVNI